ncbi:MAG: TrmH family RNA methyltransferase [Acetivibrionales bacterium]
MDIITSSQNPLVKEAKSLKLRKHRDSKGLFFIEGLRFVEEAVKRGGDIERVFVSKHFYEMGSPNSEKLLREIKSRANDVVFLTDKLFKEISDTSSPQGIAAVLRMKAARLDELIGKDNLFILLDSVQDPGNMGTIIRTADAAAFNGVIISKGCVDIYNPKVLRSTMGSVFHIPIVFSSDLSETISFLKSNGIKIYAAHLMGEKNYFDIRMANNTAIIIGNEANGVRDDIASYADGLVKIPMPGNSESLNASIAAGILMFECVRQRFKEKK